MFSVAEALGGGSFALLWLVNKAALWCHSCGGIRPEVTIIRITIIYFMGHTLASPQDTSVFRDTIMCFRAQN